MKQFKNQTAMDFFFQAISIKRPHGGQGPGKLLAQLIRLLPQDCWLDRCGNLHVDNRRKGEKTLVVAHVDTVHREDGVNKWVLDKDFVRADGSQLGADNAAGVSILVNMLLNNLPIYGIFTVGEERGGIGATYLAQAQGQLLSQFDRAITFDRRDTWSIITHQGGQRCASDEFAQALANELNDDEALLYGLDETGVYTDTKEFVEYIPECVNLSAGYFREHSVEEHQNIAFLDDLMSATLRVDWENLPTVRVAGEFDEFEQFEDFFELICSAEEGLPQDLQVYLHDQGFIDILQADQYDWPKAATKIRHELADLNFEVSLEVAVNKTLSILSKNPSATAH